jgi:hypothetical protein
MSPKEEQTVDEGNTVYARFTKDSLEEAARTHKENTDGR